jgi:hypothetical protein
MLKMVNKCSGSSAEPPIYTAWPLLLLLRFDHLLLLALLFVVTATAAALAVANVIKMVIKCGETNNEALQLAVVRALLTFTTAEHFIAHGECLLAAVRAVFNLALGSENPVNKRTACNALLQVGGQLYCAVIS